MLVTASVEGGHRSKATSLSVVRPVGVGDPRSETAVSADSVVAMPHPECYSRPKH